MYTRAVHKETEHLK